MILISILHVAFYETHYDQNYVFDRKHWLKTSFSTFDFFNLLKDYVKKAPHLILREARNYYNLCIYK